jgi:hypothetical protein
MRPVASLLGLLTWRFRLGLAGWRLRLRGLFSALLVLGGVGAAIGYAVVGRVLADREEATDRPDA